MLKILIRSLGLILCVFVLGVGWLLGSAHLQLRRVVPTLPTVAAIQARVKASSDGPVSLRWLNTGSQVTPRSLMLGSDDPDPGQPYTLCHSVFVLEWADGRTLLVDAGMTREEAANFGALGEWAGAGPVEIHTTVGEALGARNQRVDGAVFTHLHVDHTEGSRELCSLVGDKKLSVFMTPNQAREQNLHTSAGLELLQSLDCLELQELDAEPLAALPGFPGVSVINAAGHTPGSQVLVVALQGKEGITPIVFTGDVVNHIGGVTHNVGKPALYSAIIVPEYDERLGEVRQLIRTLRDDAGFEVLVSHDRNALEASSVIPY